MCMNVGVDALQIRQHVADSRRKGTSVGTGVGFAMRAHFLASPTRTYEGVGKDNNASRPSDS